VLLLLCLWHRFRLQCSNGRTTCVVGPFVLDFSYRLPHSTCTIVHFLLTVEHGYCPSHSACIIVRFLTVELSHHLSRSICIVHLSHRSRLCHCLFVFFLLSVGSSIAVQFFADTCCVIFSLYIIFHLFLLILPILFAYASGCHHRIPCAVSGFHNLSTVFSSRGATLL